MVAKAGWLQQSIGARDARPHVLQRHSVLGLGSRSNASNPMK
jgi:hypothetical protein